MPFDVVDGFPRVLLSEPGGSSAEVLFLLKLHISDSTAVD